MATVKRPDPEAKFGHLTCKEKIAQGSTGGAVWRCLCICGREIDVSEAMLLSGVARSCGCRNNRTKNLQGVKFGLLTALEPTPEKDTDGSVKWLCRCDCGNYKVVSSNKLRMEHTTSCGCIAYSTAQEAKIYVDGTCVNQMLSEKVSRNNTSGYRGVSRAGKRWQAYISYAGKMRFLGKFATKEEAAEARRKAFEKIQEHLNGLLEETADTDEGAQSGEKTSGGTARE